MNKPVLPNRFKGQNTQPQKFLSAAEMSERRAKGLFYFCDEQYTPEHYKTHKKTQLFWMEMEEEGQDGVFEEDKKNRLPEREIAQISINAIFGISYYNTMRVKGVHKKRSLFILIDSGSTHNFLNSQVAAKLGCCMLAAGNAKVQVADGNKLDVRAKVKKFKWNFQGTNFIADFMVIPLNGCDVVLGVQWLQTLGPITWDFQKLTMRFEVDQRRVVLHGIHKEFVRAVKAAKLNKIREETMQLSMLCVTQEVGEDSANLFAMETEPSMGLTYQPMVKLISDYADIFAEPKGLPLFRVNHDHKIPLVDGDNPVNQRPYRYAIQQKKCD